jgi:hypothetical protein
MIDQYSHRLRCSMGTQHQHAVNDALTALGITTRCVVAQEDQSIYVTPEDAERAEMIAHRVEERSKTWEHVLRLAVLMEHKFSLNRRKGDREGWLSMTPDEIMTKLRREVVELEQAYAEWQDRPDGAHARAVALEAADVANYCVELADRVGGL